MKRQIKVFCGTSTISDGTSPTMWTMWAVNFIATRHRCHGCFSSNVYSFNDCCDENRPKLENRIPVRVSSEQLETTRARTYFLLLRKRLFVCIFTWEHTHQATAFLRRNRLSYTVKFCYDCESKKRDNNKIFRFYSFTFFFRLIILWFIAALCDCPEAVKLLFFVQ